MKMQQVSDNCFAVLNEKNRVCDANSGLINRAGGVVIDTPSDLAHGRQMIEMFSKVWPAMPKRVVNTHVERAFREFGNDPPDAPWNTPATFDAIYKVAKAKGIEVKY
jgi:cyclase